MNDFIYTTYIKSTPEKVWQSITTPEFTRQYWGCENISDWKVGSDWTHVGADSKDIKVVGKIIESTPPTRLVMSWASPKDLSDESQVVFDISVAGDMVRLDVIHSRLSEDMGRGVGYGWPRVLSSMKTFLETGKALDTWAAAEHKCS